MIHWKWSREDMLDKLLSYLIFLQFKFFLGKISFFTFSFPWFKFIIFFKCIAVTEQKTFIRFSFVAEALATRKRYTLGPTFFHTFRLCCMMNHFFLQVIQLLNDVSFSKRLQELFVDLPTKNDFLCILQVDNSFDLFCTLHIYHI